MGVNFRGNYKSNRYSRLVNNLPQDLIQILTEKNIQFLRSLGLVVINKKWKPTFFKI